MRILLILSLVLFVYPVNAKTTPTTGNKKKTVVKPKSAEKKPPRDGKKKVDVRLQLPMPPLKRAGVIMISAGVFVALTGLIVHLAGRRKGRDANSWYRDQAPGLTFEVDNEYNSRYAAAKRMRTAAIALYSVAGACAITSLVLFVIKPKDTTESLTRGFQLAPIISSDSVGVTGTLRF